MLSAGIIALGAGWLASPDQAAAQALWRLPSQDPVTGSPIRRPQSAEPKETLNIRDVPRPDYDPLGYRVGGFIAFPEVALGEQYNSNIYATKNDKKSDFITVINPNLRVASDWNLHEVNLEVDARYNRYAHNPSENSLDLLTRLNGRYDISNTMIATGYLAAGQINEERESPDNTRGDEPTKYYRYDAGVGFGQRGLALGYKLDAQYRRIDFTSTPASGGEINNSGRSFDQYQMTGRVDYEISPAVVPFGRMQVNRREYYEQLRGQTDKDSQGYQVDVGVRFDRLQLLLAEVFIGFAHQNYDAARFDSINTPVAGAEVTWNVTRLTSISSLVTRTIEETSSANASGVIQTAFSVGVDHELRRNFLLAGEARYIQTDFKGTSREDDRYDFTVGGAYLFNRHFVLRPEYNYTLRDSNVTGGDFTRHRLMATVLARL